MTTHEKNLKRQRLENFRNQCEKRRRAKLRSRRRKTIIALIAVVSITTVILGTVYNASAKEITITEINEFTGLNSTQRIKTRGANVEDVLAERGLDISETDRLNVPTEKPVADNDDIIIKRGKKIKIKSGDYEEFVTFTKADVKDALVEAGYIPGEHDMISTDGDTIELVTISHTDETTTESIERGIEYVEDPELPVGQEKVVDEGQDGLKELQHKVTYQDGQEAERALLSENVTVEPRNKVIAKGTAVPTPEPVFLTPTPTKSSVSDNGGTVNGYSYKKKITMTATAYTTSPAENGGYSGTATGVPLGYGIAAVDPRVIPLGSKLYVTAPDGTWIYGVASAADTGGSIKGNKIDLCYPEDSDARRFGRRSCVVYVLE